MQELSALPCSPRPRAHGARRLERLRERGGQRVPADAAKEWKGRNLLHQARESEACVGTATCSCIWDANYALGHWVETVHVGGVPDDEGRAGAAAGVAEAEERVRAHVLVASLALALYRVLER